MPAPTRHHKKRSGRTSGNSTRGSSLGSSASSSGGTCTTNPQGLQPSSSLSAATPRLTGWALDVWERAQKQQLEQPWKDQLSGAHQEDDPNFDQGSDPVLFYDGRVKVCYGETSLAA